MDVPELHRGLHVCMPMSQVRLLSKHESSNAALPAISSAASCAVERDVTYPLGRMSFVILLALVFVAAPIWSLVGPGLFGWHIRQPAAWQGGLEALAVFASLTAAVRWLRGPARAVAVIAVVALYARHHGVDFAMFASYVYLEGLFALGGILMGGRVGRAPSGQVVIALAGLIGWSLLLWLASIVGLGSMTELGWLAVVVLLPALLFYRGPRLIMLLLGSVRRVSRSQPATAALIATLCLVMFAKASVSTGFDSNWYGLAADRVLLASGNVFLSEGLTAPVHYYPKLTEMLHVPLALLGSIPAVVGMNIGCWLATLGTASLILRELRVRSAWRPLIIALVATLPAFANVAMTAKGDALAAWLLSVALLAALRLRHGHGAAWFWIALAAALMASQARLSNIPYALALTLLATLFGARSLLQRRSLPRSPLPWPAMILALSSVVVFILITARTWWLTGVPLIAPNAALDLFAGWGMELRAPAGRLPTSDLLVYLPPGSTLLTYLFDPRRYPMVQIVWTGNVWLFLPLATLVLGWASPVAWRRAAPVLFIGLLFFPMLLGNKYIPASGADGNYFITPVICLILYGGFLVQQVATRWQAVPSVAATLRVLLYLFASASALMCLVTGMWGPGTRAFDLKMDRPLRDLQLRRETTWRDTGMTEFASRLQLYQTGTRVVGDIGGDGFWLPVRYEPFDIIALTRPASVDSLDSTLRFLRATNVRFLIVRRAPVESTGTQTLLWQAADRLQRTGAAEQVYADDHYALWYLPPADMLPGSRRP